jgi:hypothetical protein
LLKIYINKVAGIKSCKLISGDKLDNIALFIDEKLSNQEKDTGKIIGDFYAMLTENSITVEAKGIYLNIFVAYFGITVLVFNTVSDPERNHKLLMGFPLMK